MKIVQFGLRYSPNFGDGVISDCMAFGLQHLHPDAQIETVDISGRDGYGVVTVKSRALIIGLLHYLPQWIRHRLAHWKLGKLLDEVEPAWRTTLANADLAIIGGGMLFSDASLNFPIKVARVCDLLTETDTPTAVYGVGVSRNWSPAGTELFSKVFNTDLKMVAMRDETSRRAWAAQTPAASFEPTLVLDPGILALDCYGPVAEKTNRIGICVTDPRILGHHADSEIAGGARGANAFYTDLINALVYRGHKVTLFTNGAEEDARAMAEVAADPRMAAHKSSGFLSLAPTASTPAELAKIIGSMKGVIAHRLHACIVAYSYGCPIVGLGWDQKLQSFFGLVEALDHFVEDPKVTGDTLADMMDHALAHPATARDRARIREEAWTGLSVLLAQIRPTSMAEASVEVPQSRAVNT